MGRDGVYSHVVWEWDFSANQNMFSTNFQIIQGKALIPSGILLT